MSAAAILVSFLYLCLYIAIIILIAFAIVWLANLIFGITIDGNVYKWGKIVVGLLCLIAVVLWLVSVLGGGGGISHPFFYYPR